MGTTVGVCCAMDATEICTDGGEKWTRVREFGTEYRASEDAWKPMEVGNVDSIHKERIDPWTRDLVSEGAGSRLAGVLGLSGLVSPRLPREEAHPDAVAESHQDGPILLDAVGGGHFLTTSEPHFKSRSPIAMQRVGSRGGDSPGPLQALDQSLEADGEGESPHTEPHHKVGVPVRGARRLPAWWRLRTQQTEL